jgi:hypothetical protein
MTTIPLIGTIILEKISNSLRLVIKYVTVSTIVNYKCPSFITLAEKKRSVARLVFVGRKSGSIYFYLRKNNFFTRGENIGQNMLGFCFLKNKYFYFSREKK